MTALRVLVVDDDALNLRLAARLLRGLGHHGALASDGEKALRLLAGHAGPSFDLMLLDINMPQLSGEDTLRALRRREHGTGQPRLLVLMVSGHADDSTRRHYLAAGADGFLVKPLTAEPLAQELARLGR